MSLWCDSIGNWQFLHGRTVYIDGSISPHPPRTLYVQLPECDWLALRVQLRRISYAKNCCESKKKSSKPRRRVDFANTFFFSRLGGKFWRVDEKGKKEKWEISERFYKSVSLKVYWAITAPGRARVRKQYCRRVCCAKTVNRCPKVE